MQYPTTLKCASNKDCEIRLENNDYDGYFYVVVTIDGIEKSVTSFSSLGLAEVAYNDALRLVCDAIRKRVNF